MLLVHTMVAYIIVTTNSSEESPLSAMSPPCWNYSQPTTLVSLSSSNPHHSIWIHWNRSHRTPSPATFAKETLIFFSYKPAVLGLISKSEFYLF
jgi:hypothetical protein